MVSKRTLDQNWDVVRAHCVGIRFKRQTAMRDGKDTSNPAAR